MNLNSHPKFKCIDGEGNTVEPCEAIFPILKQLKANYWKLIGTGFYIITNGIFVTAKHVLKDVISNNRNQTNPIAAIHFFGKNKYLLRPITQAIVSNSSDVAIGITAECIHNKTNNLLKNKILTLSTKIARKNELIFTYAYPETKSKLNEIHCKPNFYEGNIIEYYPTGRDRVMLPNPCYQTSINLLGGSSGGPIFAEPGHVIAINSTSFNNSNISFISRIHEILPLYIQNVKINDNTTENHTIENLAKKGYVSLIKS